GERAGLLLSETEEVTPGGRPRDPWPGALVFDLAGRTVTADRAGWHLEEPAPAGWSSDQPRSVGTGKDAHWVLVLRHNGAEKGRVELRPGRTLQAIALLPPRPPLGVPILAVAWRHDLGQRSISLFNGLTGEEVRLLTAHTAPVRSLAFSGDGRLLVSA